MLTGSLDRPTHSLILSDLAANLARDAAAGSLTPQDYAVLQPSTASTSAQDALLSATQIRRYKGQALFATSLVDALGAEEAPAPALPFLQTALQELSEAAARLPTAAFDESVQVRGDWANADAFAATVVEGLLRLGAAAPTLRPRAISAVQKLLDALVQALRASSLRAHEATVKFVPLLHGVTRALQSSAFPWDASSSARVLSALGELAGDADALSRLDALLVILPEQSGAADQCARALGAPRSLAPAPNATPNADEEEQSYSDSLLAHYVRRGLPLSGEFAAWCALRASGAVVAQVLQGASPDLAQSRGDSECAGEAAWTALQRDAAPHVALGSGLALVAQRAGERIAQAVRSEQASAQSGIFVELYAREQLSAALQLAVLAGVAGGASDALHAGDAPALRAVALALGDEAPLQDAVLLRAALEGVAVLAQTHSALVPQLMQLVRHFIARPSPVLEADLASGAPLVHAAARSLAACVAAAGQEDVAVSTTYALLAHVGGTRDTDLDTSASADAAGAGEARSSRDVTVASVLRLVTSLAEELALPSFTTLLISLLLQRVQGADAFTRASMLRSLVPLAARAPRSSFVSVIQLYSALARSAIAARDARSLGPVQLAQMLLARALTPSAEHLAAKADVTTDDCSAQTGESRKHVYLVELLQLFIETGASLARSSAAGLPTGASAPTDATPLRGMLPVLAELLAHPDINPHLTPTEESVYFFRNTWLIITLCGLAPPLSMPLGGEEDPLNVLALKTPTLIPEGALNYIEEEIEYNTVLKHAKLGASIDSLRRDLMPLLGGRLSEMRAPTFERLAFVRAVLEVEWRRAACGRVSMVLWYFTNSGVNNSSLLAPLLGVAERVLPAFLLHVQQCMSEHRVGADITDEVRLLVVGSCHRMTPVRQVSQLYLDRIVEAYPALFGRTEVVVTLLETVTLLHQSVEDEVESAYLPRYEFHSRLAGVTLHLSDNFLLRRQVYEKLHTQTRAILERVQRAMPQELTCMLLRYVSHSSSGDASSGADHAADAGRRLALDVARGASSAAQQPPRARLVGDLTLHGEFAGELGSMLRSTRGGTLDARLEALREELHGTLERILRNELELSRTELRSALFRAAALLVASGPLVFDLVHYVVMIPMAICTRDAIQFAVQVWTWLMAERPDCETRLVGEIAHGWTYTIIARKGLYSPALVAHDPLLAKTDMSSFDHTEITRELRLAEELFGGQECVLQLLHERLQSGATRNPALVVVLVRLAERIVDARHALSNHALTREIRFVLVRFVLSVLKHTTLDALLELHLRDGACRLAIDWFATRPEWTFGGSVRRAERELGELRKLQLALRTATMRADALVTSATVSQGGGASRARLHSSQQLSARYTLAQAVQLISDELQLLSVLLLSEEARLSVWLHPTRDAHAVDTRIASGAALSCLRTAWRLDARVAVQLARRLSMAEVNAALQQLVRDAPYRVTELPEALGMLVPRGDQARSLGEREVRALSWLTIWAAVPPIDAIKLFQPEYGADPAVVQYSMRVLEEHPVDLVFFYVPQVVQALRVDSYGYVEEFILRTSRISQLFCHQIIWNMKANTHRDDNAEEEDPLKPTLERMMDRIVSGLSGGAQEFYEREFGFFNEVTSISGKLKPFIKKSKPEKKAKIDEEMAKIKVDPGVYLPSNPDSVVVDLDRRSGRPLQSHAKAPFMATFRVRREVRPSEEEAEQLAAEHKSRERRYEDVWQGAIFKVGDDCRQDQLALQVMAQFKNIFQSVGLDVYINPYRVTATGPGCGVIDVVPNATSRDEMGRAKINNLLSFFHDRYGSEDSIAFQRARLNFVQSMAAYSVVCHILQIRDRHNGNIMIDGDGHIIHIDFGFLFDIGPGGMRFEPYSFKLSLEFVEVMGGHDSPGFRMFEELVVKCFLACRPHADEIVATCGMMLGTELPSFKGPATLTRLRDRFKPDLSEREAARHAQWLVRDAYGNRRAVLYDFIQEKQNQIPYKR